MINFGKISKIIDNMLSLEYNIIKKTHDAKERR